MEAINYMADYNEAQAAGHHIDCDGWRIAHRVEIVRERYSNGSSSFRAVCEECGDLHIGSFGQEADAKSAGSGHSTDVRCDGRCKEWN